MVLKYMLCVKLDRVAVLQGSILMTGLEKGLERKKIIYAPYDSLEMKKINVSYNGLEN